MGNFSANGKSIFPKLGADACFLGIAYSAQNACFAWGWATFYPKRLVVFLEIFARMKPMEQQITTDQIKALHLARLGVSAQELGKRLEAFAASLPNAQDAIKGFVEASKLLSPRKG